MVEIVGLHGRTAPTADGTEPEVIQILEEALARARSGEIVGVAIAAVHGNNHIWTRASKGHMHYLVAACSYLQYDLVRVGTTE